MKSIIAAGLLLGCAHGAAQAGPYANIEANSGWVGSDFDGSVVEIHKGYEGELGEKGTWFVQGGPAIVAADGVDTETEFSGKAGVGVAIADGLGAYGELSFITVDGQDDLNVGGKLGLKYNF